MATITEALQIALAHHQAGRIAQAEQIYRQILALQPDHPDALHLLGVIARQSGHHEAAASYIARAIALRPSDPAYHNNLGNALQAQGKFEEAIASYQRALQLQPADAEVHYNLGNALKDLGKLDEAIACYQQALQLKPDFAEAYNNLGNALKDLGKLGEAIACHQRALQLKPDYTEAYNNLGNALMDHGRLDEAIACYQQALQLKPDFVEGLNNLAVALETQGKLDDAIACCHRALDLKPGFAEAHTNLGNALKDLGKLDEAIACYQQALQLKPDNAAAYNSLGSALMDHGKLDEAIACYQRALQLNPELSTATDNYLCLLRYHPDVTPAALSAAHAEYDRRHAATLRAAWRAHDNSREPERPLLLGFVSPRFAHGPIGAFLIRALENLDRRECRIVCYSNRSVIDDMTARFQAVATAWHNVAGMTDEQLAKQVHQDHVDILFDLAGHARWNRLLVFARKPAPLQVTWIDSVGTTGLSAMDYLLADRQLIPAEAETHYVERVLRLPDGYVCYEPPAEAPPVGPLPALARGYVTFASFNQIAKMNRRIIKVWSRILRRLPGSRLVLKHRGLNTQAASRYWRQLFQAEGTQRERLELQGHSPRVEYLGQYRQIDIALDPFPHNGGLTTCDSLWMGVPVVTCAGDTFASRQSLSHLANVGFTETIARDLDEYVELAVKLAEDLPRLAEIRAGLRERMAASPLCDGKRFAQNLLKILRSVWRDWCEPK